MAPKGIVTVTLVLKSVLYWRVNTLITSMSPNGLVIKCFSLPIALLSGPLNKGMKARKPGECVPPGRVWQGAEKPSSGELWCDSPCSLPLPIIEWNPEPSIHILHCSFLGCINWNNSSDHRGYLKHKVRCIRIGSLANTWQTFAESRHKTPRNDTGERKSQTLSLNNKSSQLACVCYIH